ncbi:ParA family protein [Phaeobacter gallaeciensis]|uniref:ParA family protein n=1 Tax=Phaeobacter gallaeciensis TaxID=60890 RepID=UPI0023805128|nr:ParA family protein [Phaeobacter gallaeciensis]MDE4297108.1 ParA family protein [Phaeobacter gallaeciensis]
MADLVIACLSQKGGVGKSTLARLIARTYAISGWTVKICDFNTTQLTSQKWARVRDELSVKPSIVAEAFISPSRLRREDFNLVVADGRPDSDQSSLDIARVSDLIILPTGLALDDLEPQLGFAKELVDKGIDAQRILFVLNKTDDSAVALSEARDYLSDFAVAQQDIVARNSYQRAQNHGKALSEVADHVGKLAERADLLAAEIVAHINDMEAHAA